MNEHVGTNSSIANEERRQGRRFAVSWATRLTGIDESGRRFEHEVSLANLSSGGAYFPFAKPLPVGSRLEVSIRVPFKHENWMQYTGEVIRVDQLSEVDSSSASVGIALRFNGFRPSFAGK